MQLHTYGSVATGGTVAYVGRREHPGLPELRQQPLRLAGRYGHQQSAGCLGIAEESTCNYWNLFAPVCVPGKIVQVVGSASRYNSGCCKICRLGEKRAPCRQTAQRSRRWQP